MMTKKTTKRALLTSVMALLICFSMLLGTTYAWFTDSVTSSGNKIVSGSLKVDLEVLDEATATAGEAWRSVKTDNAPIFNYDNWEPGYVQVKILRVVNEGTLALKWKATLVTSAALSKLSDVIDVYVKEDIESYAGITRELDGWTKLGTLTDFIANIATTTVGEIPAKTAADVDFPYEAMGIAFKMQDTAGNEYQELTLGDFDIQILATQLAYEEDSFDNTYDNGSVFIENVTENVEIPDNATEEVVFGNDEIAVELPADVVNTIPDAVETLTLAYSTPVVDRNANTVTFKSIEMVDQNGEVVDLSANTVPFTVSFAVPFADGTIVDVFHDGEIICATEVKNGVITYEALHFCEVVFAEATPVEADSAEALKAVRPGQTVNLVADITLDAEYEIPAGVTLVGYGKDINGTIYAGGDLTIEGHVKATSFSASYYNRVITIGEDACLEVTGTGRMTLGYGNVFNITGTIDDAKTADKANVQPSLIIPGGISITGGNDAVMNVTNAYIVVGSTSSKNSAANGTFELNFDNSIAEFTDQLTFSEPTSGKTPTFKLNVTDSVLTTGTKLIMAAPKTVAVVDNSIVTLATYFRNSGNLTVKNGSVFTGATIQFGENGGNDGATVVDNAKFTITASSTGHALDGKGVGSIEAVKGAEVAVDYYKAITVTCDDASTFTGTEVK